MLPESQPEGRLRMVRCSITPTTDTAAALGCQAIAPPARGAAGQNSGKIAAPGFRALRIVLL